MFAALLGVTLNQNLSPTSMLAWSWRIPLGVGCLIVPFLFWLRRGLEETPAFNARTPPPTPAALLKELRAHTPLVIKGIGLGLMSSVKFLFYHCIYSDIWSRTAAPRRHAKFGDHAFCRREQLDLAPAGRGAFGSDRIGRKPILLTCTLLALFTAYPPCIGSGRVRVLRGW